jgi:starch phosphorylase
VSRESDAELSSEVFTLGFARRATAYKRAALVFRDLDRLADMTSAARPLQIVFAGKAHPRDEDGKAMIQQIFAAARELRGRVCVAYLTNYDMDLARILCAGCDVWLNTPIAPLEASGTSGMKAALNGVPSLSIQDGWWVEGCVEGVTGWAIGIDGERADVPQPERDAEDARALYDKLERAVLPCFYEHSERFWDVMRGAIALNASFFNTHRMMLQYLYDAYRVAPDE